MWSLERCGLGPHSVLVELVSSSKIRCGPRSQLVWEVNSLEGEHLQLLVDGERFGLQLASLHVSECLLNKFMNSEKMRTKFS